MVFELRLGRFEDRSGLEGRTQGINDVLGVFAFGNAAIAKMTFAFG